MARKTIIAGNWKMNLLPEQGEALVADLNSGLLPKENLEVVIFPPVGMIALARDWTWNSGISLGSQNCSDHLSGAFTGETSAELLKVLGCKYCLAGHSERRELFGETNEFVGRKAEILISMGISPIVCVGETLVERESGKHFEKLATQVQSTFEQVSREGWAGLIFAYEPVWAIGTGKTATPEQANDVHVFIREQIKGVAGEVVAEATSILYGGSAKPSNAAELLAKSDIDGLLVGGASLTAEEFAQIISVF